MKRRVLEHTSAITQVVIDPKIHQKHKPHRAGSVQVGLLIALVIVSLTVGNAFRSFRRELHHSAEGRHETLRQSSVKNVTITNEFVSTFQEVMLRPVFDMENAVPLILHRGKLLCRANHKHQIMNMRVLSFLEMVSRGIELNYYQSTLPLDNVGLPILLLNGDGMGCNIATHTDNMPFPRLSWAIPAPKHLQDEDWCNSVGMVSYETWNAFHKRHDKHFTWDDTFANDEKRFPWDKKIPKVVWRGTTTHEQTQYRDAEFSDIPRAKLVQASIENPEIIDAGFTAIIQKFEKDKEKLAKQTRVADYIKFVDQMKYKAFFDIDGNNWSSRFIMLLCTNAVVIKVDPDYVDYWYEDLIPGIHYIPASLENMTEVAKYVVDPQNDEEMKSVVKAANSWCKRTLTEEVLIRDEMYQLEEYESALEAYDETNHWMNQWRALRTSGIINDLVECT